MTQQQKISEIKKITRKQISITNQLFKMATLKSKRMDVVMKRCSKIVALGFEFRSLELQKRIIMSQPAPRFAPGGLLSGQVKEAGKEVVQMPNGKKVQI